MPVRWIRAKSTGLADDRREAELVERHRMAASFRGILGPMGSTA